MPRPHNRTTLAEFKLDWLSKFDSEWRDLSGHPWEIQIATVRRQAFERTPFCVRCGKKGTSLILISHVQCKNTRSVELIDRFGTRMTIDHILPKCRGGKTELSNLQVLCSDCNRTKGSMSQRAFVNQDVRNGYEWRLREAPQPE